MVYLSAESHPFKYQPLKIDRTENRTHDLATTSPTSYRYTIKPPLWPIHTYDADEA